MGIKMAVAFANIFMAKIEMQILNEGAHKPFVWKRYIDDIIFLLRQFIEEANKLYPIIKFKADIFVSAATLLDAAIYKGERFNRESVLDTRTHFRYKFSTTRYRQGGHLPVSASGGGHGYT